MSTQAPQDIKTPTVTYRRNVYNAERDMTVTPKRTGYTEREILLHHSSVDVEVAPGGDLEVLVTGQYVSPDGRLSRQNTTIRCGLIETEHVYSFEELPEWARTRLHNVIRSAER